MNRLELSWLLQTCRQAARLALAQYERGRISLQAMTDAIRDRFLISRDLNQFFAMLIWDLIQYASTKIPIATR
jgi:hypothetical protein